MIPNRKFLWVIALVALPALAATTYNYFAPGGALSCTSPCTTQNVNLAANTFLLNTLGNSKLTNSSITLNGGTVTLGGTRTLALASIDFANQGTSTTLLHGNAAGNTSFGPVNLATDTTGTLSLAQLATCAATNVLYANSGTAIACSAKFTWNNTTNVFQIGNSTLDGTIENGAANKITIGPNDGIHIFAPSIDMVLDGGDIFVTGSNNPLFLIQNTFSGATGFNGFQFANDVGDGLNFGNQPLAATSCSYLNSTFYTLTPAGPCSLVDSGSQNAHPLPLVLGVNGHTAAVLQNNDHLWAVGTTPVQYLRTLNTSGIIGTVVGSSTNASSTTNIVAGSTANLTGNGSPICTTATGCAATTTKLTGTTGSIGGGALLAGACASGTVSITGLTTAMVIHATPVTFPGDGFWWEAYNSAGTTATIKVCASIAGTPTASNYNVRVLQ